MLQKFELVYEEAKLQALEHGMAGEAGSLSQFGGQQARRKQFAAVSNDLNQIFFDFPFTVPRYFALITRALITLEGIALVGDSNFDIFQSSYPYALEFAVSIFGISNAMQILQKGSLAELAAAKDMVKKVLGSDALLELKAA